VSGANGNSGKGSNDGERVERIAGAGKGGAGLLTCLKTLGYTAAAKGWNMAYTSDYNPETRGGLVEGTLVVSSHEPVDNPITSDAGAARLANMAMLGLFNKLLGLFTVDDLIKGMESYLPVWRHKLIPGNRQVLETVTLMDVESYRVS
jgi:Pyruvate/2-oxoacid:ferredoxin oxidoreductase gamma subunit